MEKEWFYERLFFKVVTVIVKDKKCSIKRKISIKISYDYIKWTKVMFTSSFRGISNGLYLCATFFFSLSLSISKRLTLAKIWGLQPIINLSQYIFLTVSYMLHI